jgi:hypothetical protein
MIYRADLVNLPLPHRWQEEYPHMYSRLCLAVVLLALAACSGPIEWSKPGVPPERVADDLAECRHTAQSELSRDTNIDADIMASRGADWGRTGTLQSQQFADSRSTSARSSAIVESCMTEKGYTKLR